jgi:glycosyltransferase involved in cell wall biosynthesis
MFMLFREFRPDIIHVHYLSPFGALAGLYGSITGFGSIVLTPWGSDVLLAGRLARKLVKYLIRRASAITCDAEHIRKAAFLMGGNPKRIVLIYFGTDVRKFSPESASDGLRRDLGTLGWPSVISCRALNPLYDVRSLVAALPEVVEEVPGARIVIAGRGSQETELKELSRELGVSDSVAFVGNIPNDQLPAYFSSSDIYISTSTSDAGLSASTAEAMACGLPVIVTDFGDNGKWVQHGLNGLIVPLRDPESVARSIVHEHRNNYYREMEKVGRLYEQMAQECLA